jgi:hypothetical protein
MAVITLSIALLILAPVASPGGTTKKWVTGTIMDVKRHDAKAEEPSTADQWDVSVKVGDTIYVVLVTAPPGNTGIEYRKGMDKNVLVGEKTITFNDLLGRTYVMPIISTRPATRRPTH